MSRRKRRQKSKSLAGRATRLPSPVRGRGVGGEGALPAERLRPWLLAAVVALLVVRPLYPSEWPAETGDGLPVVMLWIAVAVVWMLVAIGRRQFRVRFGWTDAAVLGLIAWHTLAAIVATARASPRPALNMLWEWIGLGLAYFLARQFIATRREARAVVAVMVALAVGLSGYGLYQVSYGLEQNRAVYYKDPDKALREIDMWSPEGSPERAAYEKRLESREPLATFALTNSLAGYLAPWLIVAAGIALGAGGPPRPRGADGTRSSPLPRAGEGLGVRAGRGSSGGRGREADRPSVSESPHPSPLPEGEGIPWRTWIAVACCAVPVAVCLVLTKSRSAYLATLVGLVGLAAWWLWPRRDGGRLGRAGWKVPAAVVLAVALLLGAVVAAAVATGGLDRQVVSQASVSLRYRLEYWQATLRMIADHPFLGCGPGNFQQEYTRYKLPEASEEVADPHNFLLEVWATAGTPAMLALLAVLGTFAWTLWRRSAVGRIGNPSYERRRTGSPSYGELGEADPGRPDGTAFVLAGGAGGFVLAACVGLISAAPPGLVALVLGLPLAGGSAALLWPWIREGRLPPFVVAIGLVVLLVNLLAAGGIGFAGVAGTLWVLLALGLNMAGEEDRRTLPWSAAVAGLVVALALAFACHVTAYSPVLRSQAAIRQAQREKDGLARILLLKKAAEYDSRSAAPCEQLASVAFQWWLDDPVPEGSALDSFDKSTQTALELAPNSATLWRAVGERYLEIGKRLTEISRKDRDPAYRDRAAWAFDRAVQHYRRAVELYPNSAGCRAGLAEALLWAGDREGSAQEAEEALRLDGLTPHADKKLPDELRKKLLRTLSRP